MSKWDDDWGFLNDVFAWCCGFGVGWLVWG